MLHKVSPLPTSAFAFFRSTKLSLGIINTSILAPSLCHWDASSLSPITTLVFRRLRLKFFEVLASTSGHSFIFSFGCIGKEDGTSDVGGGESSRFPCDCRADLDTRDVPLSWDKQLTKHMSQWAPHSGYYQVFEHSHGEVVRYRKSYQMNLRWLKNPAIWLF